MKKWTKQAEERLGEYLNARVERDGLEGEDARELREDLRAHVQEEAEVLCMDMIGVAELERLLLKMDGGVVEKWTPVIAESRRGRLYFFGVILPLAVTVFEMVSGFCAGVFFDPVPTFLHGVLLIAVPFLNGWLLTKGRAAGSRVQGIAAGLALAVSGFYGLLFLPLLPASIFAMVFFGLGLLSLSPILALVAVWRIAKRNRDGAVQPWRFRSGLKMGAGAVIALLLAMEGPGIWTRYQLSRANSDQKAVAESGVAMLRVFSSERTLLKACYEGNRGTTMATDISGWMGKGWKFPASMVGFNVWGEADSDKARDVFFRATGKPFNSLKPPKLSAGGLLGRGRGMDMDEFEFDDALGGDDVAIRLKDLDLAESRFDGHVDTASRLGYGEWTMVFANTSSQVKEARCQVRLPKDGKVSRLTLWVNGEPREAAFNSVSKVKAAYKSVAVVQRLDPVLVTMAGPDTVLVQCFPVPAHGEMKIRIGITSPLEGGCWVLPRVVERNFGIREGAENALWMQADAAFEFSGAEGLAGSMKDGEGFSANAVRDLGGDLDRLLAVRFEGLAEVPEKVWCEDQFAKEGERFLERRMEKTHRPAVGRLIVVIDGSASMKGAGRRLAWMFAELFPGKDIELIIADDGVRKTDTDGLASYRFSGGRDNEAALRAAVSRAKDGGNGAVVWLHGPQAVKLSAGEALLQLLERGTHRPDIYDVEMVPGPNRLSDQLGKEGFLKRGPTLFDPDPDLRKFLTGLLEGRDELSPVWRRAQAEEGLEGKRVWDQLARSWAMERSESQDVDRALIAAKYQLVTPVSGAVVLETMEQFKQHGLDPVDVSAAPSIPNIPEPSGAVLVLLAAIAGLLRRRRCGGAGA